MRPVTEICCPFRNRKAPVTIGIERSAAGKVKADMANHSRLERVASLIQQEISKLFIKGLKDPRIGFVTITGAKVSPDLREAWVYYTVHGDEAERRRTAQGIESAKGYLRKELGSRMTQRVTPELHFVIDKAIDEGARIEDLFARIHAEDAAREAEYGHGGSEESEETPLKREDKAGSEDQPADSSGEG